MSIRTQVVRSQLSKWVHNRASDQQTHLQPLTGLLDVSLVFTAIHTSTLRMIYVHNQVLFEQKKRVLHLVNIIKVFVGVTSLSPAS